MDGEQERIRQRSRQESDETRLLKKGKRGVLNLIYGRTLLVVLTLAMQIGLLMLAFNTLESLSPYFYILLLAVYVGTILHLVNKRSEPYSKITWILLVVLAPTVGLTLYLFVELDVGR